ncbi:YmaF family protein [Brevibacillus centrosporus]|uniref:YmaF family protein n=1 Tax=Brevibacillus centrosporus TaxID=54910 RepID=UPI002E1E2943|nr:YmaF family protein [Brevibacillus centrosporus]
MYGILAVIRRCQVTACSYDRVVLAKKEGLPIAKKKLRKTQASRVNRVRHRMEGVTSLVDNHRHLFSNVSDIVVRVPSQRSHFHRFRAITTTADGHRHLYFGQTGLSINGTGPFGGGPNHFHRVNVLTQITRGHRHRINGTTTTNRVIRNSRP